MPRIRTPSGQASSNKGRPGRKDGKAYRLTCSNCRSRKVKCDGDQPQCRICLAYGEECHFDKPPPMSQVLAMQARIEELERELANQRLANEQSPSRAGIRDSLAEHVPTPGSAGTVPFTAVGGDMSRWRLESPSYQSTSAVREPILCRKEEVFSLKNSTTSAPQIYPTWNEDQLTFWEDAAAKAAAVQLNLPVDKVAHLFQTHWIWIHPAFPFVSKMHFLRDTANGGKNSSQLLVSSLCLHSTRFTDHHLKEDLLHRTRLLLGQALHEDPSISTTQALLQLSAREIGRGGLSQCWLYSGMAFRMAVDMGIFAKVNSLSPDPEQQAVNDQLAWSCYLWDKCVSLYLGRTPVLPEPPNFDPPLSDELAEASYWQPYFGQQQHSESRQNLSFVSHGGTCFANFCKLSTIVTDILLTVYGKGVPAADPKLFVHQTRQRLEIWRAESPAHLVVDRDTDLCAPPHVLTQNALYYASIILLHRPFRQSAPCLSICRDAADAMEHLILMLDRSYGLSYTTYLMSYCAYTAATIAVLDMHDRVEGSQRKVNNYLRALHGVQLCCPGIQRSIDIIVKAFDMATAPSIPPLSQPVISNSSLPADALPAFPHEPAMDAFQYSGMDPVDFESLPFGDLDPFALEWTRLPMEAFDEYLATAQ